MLNYLTSNYYIHFEHDWKILIATILILITVISNMFLEYRVKISNKEDKEYINYVKEVRYDLLKYLLIESSIIITEVIETGKFNIISSLARISFVQLALIIFHTYKHYLLGNMKKK
jgi:hypothetical protein